MTTSHSSGPLRFRSSRVCTRRLTISISTGPCSPSRARLLKKHGQTVAGYNAQVAIDAKHKLIVASEVVNDGNDTGQLHAVADAAKQALGVETLTVLADSGYYNGETLKDCEADGITAYVPPPQRNGRLVAQGRFSHEEFRYDADADAYRCPAEALLRPMSGHKEDASGKRYILYVSRKSDCGTCPLRGRCLSDKADRRTIYRWEHEDVLERHRARMADAAELMRRRSALAEHPFGTLKCRAGYRHFLLRGFDKVRGEWSLMALCYNLSRVAAGVGIGPLIAYLAKPAAQFVLLLLWRVIAAVMDRIRQLQTVIWRTGPFRRIRPPQPRLSSVVKARTEYAAKPINPSSTRAPCSQPILSCSKIAPGVAGEPSMSCLHLSRRELVAATLAAPAFLGARARAAGTIQMISHRYPALEYYAEKMRGAIPGTTVNTQLMPIDKALELATIALSSKADTIDIVYANDIELPDLREEWLAAPARRSLGEVPRRIQAGRLPRSRPARPTRTTGISMSCRTRSTR